MIILYPFNVREISRDDPLFMSDVGDCVFISFFFVSLAKDLSNLSVFPKNPIFVLLIFLY